MNAVGDKLDGSLFISDLHLCATRPQIGHVLVKFLHNVASHARELYILGDLFEYWAGDDDVEDSYLQPIIQAFLRLAQHGVHIYFMHGNRDFLIAEHFCQSAGMTLLKDPTLINLYGKKILLSHGDVLCTDDADYQAFRQLVRDEKWQLVFLSQPLASRKAQIEALRVRSDHAKANKSAEIMDINPLALNALLSAYDYPEFFVHGHTHRPAQHQINLSGHSITRWVLGDWYEQGSYLRVDQHGFKTVNL